MNNLERAKQLYDDTGGPGNQGAIWKILGLLIEYLLSRKGQ